MIDEGHEAALAEGPTGGLLQPYASLIDAVGGRRSRRSFDKTPVPSADLDELAEMASGFRPWPGVRVVVLASAPQSVFAGIIGAYGGVSGSPSALVFIGGRDAPPEMVGYTGEAVVLAATARGLDTCWVAGVFSRSAAVRLAGLLPDERAFAVSPLGHAQVRESAKERALFGAARAKHRRTFDEIAPGSGSWPAWAAGAVAAARVAPSAMNRQPWRFRLEDGALVVAHAGADILHTSKRLDCGIAMLHAELGAMAEGTTGRWELLAGNDVARFVPAAT